MPSIVLVEDDARIRDALTRALTARGHVVRAERAALPGLEAVIAARPDLVILDLGLPDLDGRELLRMIRSVSDVPIIVATAVDDEAEIVRVLDAGADDYVVKPFSADQIEARMRALLRRVDAEGAAGPIEIGALELDVRSREARLDGEPLELTRKEFDLLAALAARAGQVVTKQELLADVWHLPYGGSDKTVDVHLSWLRRKLGETAAAPRYLHTVRGVGVKLVAPST